jgi:DNA-binding NtrC family response regulator
MIAASHRNLEQLVTEGKFREDLFYRVNVLTVSLPPLRERREDIPLLAEALLARAAREAGHPVPFLPREVVAALVAHDWPGNVRELENEMRRIVVLASEEVRLEHLSSTVRERRSLHLPTNARPGAPDFGGSIRDQVADLEQRSIEAALHSVSGNKSRAAKVLGISRFALQRKLDKYGLGRGGDDADAEETLDGEVDPGVESPTATTPEIES